MPQMEPDPKPIADTITLTGCTIKNLRADVLKGSATLTIETYLDLDLLRAKPVLSQIAAQSRRVDITITEQQLKLDL